MTRTWESCDRNTREAAYLLRALPVFEDSYRPPRIAVVTNGDGFHRYMVLSGMSFDMQSEWDHGFLFASVFTGAFFYYQKNIIT